MEQLTLSILIPIFNAGSTLKRCLESIKNQTIKDYECILINDGSTDDSSEIADSFCSDDSRFHLISLNKNHGVSFARNVGLKRCKGSFIGWVDADDYINPDHFESLIDSIKNITLRWRFVMLIFLLKEEWFEK